MLKAGERIGRYVVRKAIGVGGMGVVYLAHDPDLDRLVALKLLHRDDGDGDAREHLLGEAQATARLSHPNVVSVYDVGHYEGGSFIALEYVQGATLRQWLQQTSRSWSEIVEVLVHAGRGLDAAHGVGLVHRDFKPDNVLVGADGRVRVADFGLARSLDVPSGEDDALRVLGRTIEAGNLGGTPGYMAPEQLCAGSVDHRSDLFALCVTLWEALAGELPFGGATVSEHFTHVLRGQLRPFPRDSGVPITVIEALQRGLEVEPDARWLSVGDLLRALASAVGETSAPSGSIVRPFALSEDVAMPSSLGHRYRLLEPFADGTLGPIYRARDRLGGQLVAIKRALGLGARRSGESGEGPRLLLARSLRRSLALRHPNLASVLDFGFDDDESAYFVLELADSARPLLSVAKEAPRAIQVNLVGQLLRVLIYLHRRGRVGLCLTHQSVVVEQSTLKVIDTDWLGSPTEDWLDETLRPSHGPALVQDDGPTVAADLYDVGVMMAALFGGAGEHSDEIREAALLSAAKAGDLERSASIEGPLAALISRLLDEDPEARPRTAEETLRLLAEASGVDLPIETVHTRESFLQGVALVSRRGELERLTTALRTSVRGRGHAIAYGGESGVGKSRLIEEVRALGLVHGAVVLDGYASRDGGRLFDAWRPLLRWLVISSPLTDLEASVLRVGVPDIDHLLGRAVPSAPLLDAGATQLRLFQAILALVRRQARPLVLLLEDLHWARSETLDLLAAFTRELERLRVLVVISYRDEEAPQLFVEDPGIERRRLGRLDRIGIAAIAAAFVGEGGRRQELVELLVRETEGNALFVVEVMRALAEEAGSLDAVASMELPETIASGGISRVLQRRLGRLSASTRRMLEIAAVSGRAFDLELLGEDAPDDLSRRTEGVAEAERRGVIERYGASWRFTHDKFRESILGELAPERLRELHVTLAQALEQAQDKDRAEELAYHYRALGRADKELVYTALAGQRVIRSSPREGAQLLLRAVELGEAANADATDIGRWQRLVADAQFVSGDMDKALTSARAGLKSLGYGWPASTVGWLFLLITQLVVQLVHIVRRPRGSARPGKLRAAGQIAGRATQIYVYTFEQLPLIAGSLRAVNLAQRGGLTEPRAIAFLAYAAGLMGSDGLAERYFAEGRAGAEELDDVSSRCDLDVMAAVFATSRADFSRAVELGRKALALAQESGFALGAAQAEGILGCVHYYRGDLPAFLKAYKRAVELMHGSKSGHLRGIGWGMSWALSELGRDDEAMGRCDEVLLETPPHEKLHLSMNHSLRAVLLTRKGRLTEAVEAADETMRHAAVGTIPGNTPIILSGPAEAYISAWESNLSDGPASKRLRTKALRQLRAIRLWARFNPIGRPLVDLIGGRIALLDGAPAKAQASWTAALGQAEALQLGLWQGQAHLMLALYGDRRLRDRHRATAEHLLRRCGASFRLGPIGSYNALLSSTPD